MDWQEKEQEDEQDQEFVAFLRQFRPVTPPTFTAVRLGRLVTPRTLAIAAAVVLACAIPARFLLNQRAADGQTRAGTSDIRLVPTSGAEQTTAGAGPTRVRQENSALGRALNLIPSVETTLSAFAPPSTPQERVDVVLPAAPRRKVVARVKPAYPPEAQRLGLEAYVVLKLTVNPAGDVTETERITGVVNLRADEDHAPERAEFYAANPYAFAIAAEAAAREWKFETANSEMTCFASFIFRLTPGPDLTQNTSSRSGAATLSPVPGSSRPGLPVPSGPALAPSGPTRVDGQTIKSPRRLVNVNPVYPSEAQAADVGGVVILEITISEDGSVTNAQVVRSIPMLDQAAIDAVLQWVYEPTLLNGVPIAIKSIVTISFNLRR